MTKVWDFLYEDQETGEVFYVECASREEADAIAQENFDDPVYIRTDEEWQAEAYGYDTY